MEEQKLQRLQGGEPVVLYAQRDIGKIHKRGDEVRVQQVDAREIMTAQPSDWGYHPPGEKAKTAAVREAQRTEGTGGDPWSIYAVPELPKTVADLMSEAGFDTVEALESATVEDLTAIRGVGTKYAEAVLAAARHAASRGGG